MYQAVGIMEMLKKELQNVEKIKRGVVNYEDLNLKDLELFSYHLVDKYSLLNLKHMQDIVELNLEGYKSPIRDMDDFKQDFLSHYSTFIIAIITTIINLIIAIITAENVSSTVLLDTASTIVGVFINTAAGFLAIIFIVSTLYYFLVRSRQLKKIQKYKFTLVILKRCVEISVEKRAEKSEENIAEESEENRAEKSEDDFTESD